MTDTSPALVALEAELITLLGPDGVSSDLDKRKRASLDGAWMSPLLKEQLPLGLADLVAFPASADEIAATVAAAVRAGIPITPRGAGTGNYGQAIPMPGGLVLDMSRARAIVEVGEGFVTAEAGTPLDELENAAREAGQQLWMYPSTAQSSVGGFLSGGSGGTGTIAHGANHQGFALALDVVFADETGEIHHVEGDEAQQFVHNYGTAGILVRATVALEPLQDWRGVYASFPDFPAALAVLRELGRVDPLPRLVSADTPEIAAALPEDPGFPAGRASLRGIFDVRSLDAATTLIERAGGRVEDIREGVDEPIRLSKLSYNHPIAWLQHRNPGVYFHVEVGGDALIERIDEVHAVYPGGLLHIEAGHTVPIGMLAGHYENPEQVLAGIAALQELGVGVHNPHQWNVDFELDRTVALAKTTDPRGLLNPGKLNPGYAGPTKGSIR